MKRKSTTTEHAATKDKCATQGCVGGTDTEPAALEPDTTSFHGPGKDGRVETGSGDMTIKSLADVVSKLASECDASAVALCSAVRTLQKGVQAEIRNLCNRWGVQLTAKNDNGKYSKRGGDVLKSERTATFIEKAREHFRAKATETQQLQQLKRQNKKTALMLFLLRQVIKKLT